MIYTMIARYHAKEKAAIRKYGREMLEPLPINQRLHFRMHGHHKPRART